MDTPTNDVIKWPEFNTPPREETPEEILRQWAAGLEKRTGGLVTAEVSSNYSPDGGIIVHRFLLKAPYMGKSGYTYVLFRIRGEGVKLYPVIIYDFEDVSDLPRDKYGRSSIKIEELPPNYFEMTVQNAEILKERIHNIIMDKRTKEIIETLMVRSKKPHTPEKQKIE